MNVQFNELGKRFVKDEQQESCYSLVIGIETKKISMYFEGDDIPLEVYADWSVFND